MNNSQYPATISDFYLDKYEATVGRFRTFVNAGKGTQANPPSPGDGAHPLIAGSGWQSAWNTQLKANTDQLKASLNPETPCTWTAAPGTKENRPSNCMTWYEAFAFCAWDGGRLATDAEWNYAAAGGNEQRQYPWGSAAPDSTYAVYGAATIQNVGSRSPKGDGKWGHVDLAGNVWEWTLDWLGSLPVPCSNCANLTAASNRVVRGGSYGSAASEFVSSYRGSFTPSSRRRDSGPRCVRTP